MFEKRPYLGLRDIFKRYWKAYGGRKAFFSSPYFHISFCFSLFSYSVWIDPKWIDLPLSIIPSVIGFSLGGYAIWLTLGDEKFRTSISGSAKPDVESPFIKLNSAFVHFIFFQFLSVFYALASKVRPFHSMPIEVKIYLASLLPWLYEISKYLKFLMWFVGYWLFLYALLSGVAATMAIFRVAGWLDKYHAPKLKSTDNIVSPPANDE